MTEDLVTMSLEALEAFVSRVLEAMGLDGPHLTSVVQAIVAGERDDCGAHGLYRLILCLTTIRAGSVCLSAKPEVDDRGHASFKLDGRRCFAPYAHALALPILRDKARHHGISAVGINQCFHFAALWPEVETLARQGLVAFAFTSNHAWVAPAGGNKPLFGTNPMSFGWPRPDKNPYVFDFATSAVARGEIELAQRQGKPIPPDWGLDAAGNPSTSPADVLAGAMLTFGGHKGSALATMIELVAGPLIGDMTSVESLQEDDGNAAAPLGGEFIVAIEPKKLMGGEHNRNFERAERVLDAISDQGARVPAERRYRARARAQEKGVRVQAALLKEVERLAAAALR